MRRIELSYGDRDVEMLWEAVKRLNTMRELNIRGKFVFQYGVTEFQDGDPVTVIWDDPGHITIELPD